MYVQGQDDSQIKNDNKARTLDCIYLQYNDNHQGGHKLLHLPTNQLITRCYITVLPITLNVIQQVHQLAEQDRITRGLKIKNQTNQILNDSTRIAGVEYHNEQNEELPNNKDDISSEE
jgi:hypothetical protein